MRRFEGKVGGHGWLALLLRIPSPLQVLRLLDGYLRICERFRIVVRVRSLLGWWVGEEG